MKNFLSFIFLLVFLYGCQSDSDSSDAVSVSSTPAINYSVANYYPHDTSLFTEGFTIHNGVLYESTGSPNPQLKSMIVSSDLLSGKFEKKIELDNSKYFGEGIVFLKEKLYQLTYKTRVGFIYDATSFKKIGEFKYKNTEGWSLTTDGINLIMSDGTDILTYLNPESLKPVRSLKVTENSVARDSLNELEFIKGYIYANIWLNNHIVKIDPSTGKVVGKLDLSSLTYEAKIKNPNADVLNGIAYDSASDAILVTGKLWPNIYHIKFEH